MNDVSRLPFVLSLLDDPSPVVREGLVRELSAYGNALGKALAALPVPVSDAQHELLRKVLAEESRRRFQAAWPQWQEATTDPAQLEAGLSMVSDFVGGGLHSVTLSQELDRLTDLYRESTAAPAARELAGFLFETLGFSGDEWNYYHRDNSDLVAVIARRRGNPLSLSVLYMLIGARLGLTVEGCNFPSHFLARVREGDQVYFVDGYHRGRFLDEEHLLLAHSGATDGLAAVLREKVTAVHMMRRTVANLIRAHDQDEPSRDMLMACLADLDGLSPEDGVTSPEDEVTVFRVGQVVRHRRYGYRGVVVSQDPECRADESWYRSNRTRPDREQPWYSVLVDGTGQVTYAAHSSLAGDDSKLPVQHPLVPQFFAGFDGERHVRNDRPWPGWSA